MTDKDKRRHEGGMSYYSIVDKHKVALVVDGLCTSCRQPSGSKCLHRWQVVVLQLCGLEYCFGLRYIVVIAVYNCVGSS